MRVVVIGAGLGGLCCAQGLHQAGIDVEVYERDPGVTARFQGYRIGLEPAGVDALEHCLPPRRRPLLDAVVGDLAGPRQVLDPQLNLRGDLGWASAVVADRHVLRHLLLAGLGDRLHTGKALTGYQVRADGAVTARFADGTSTTADLLVGADGVGSAVRAVLAPDTAPTDTGVRTVIGRTPLTERFAGLVPGFGTMVEGTDTTLMLGPMRFRTPPRQAAATLAPEVELPDVGDYLRWVMIVAPHEDLRGTDPQRAVLDRTVGWHPDVRAVIEQADRDNSTLLAIRTVEPGARWPVGPVTLLGDAIHATSPSGGNGANTALRDAAALTDALAAVAAGRQDLRTAVDGYERAMFAYGAAAVRHSVAMLPVFVPTPPSRKSW